MPAMVVYILFSEIVISCEYIPLVDIIPIISHRHQSLEQLDVIAAVDKPENRKPFCCTRTCHIGTIFFQTSNHNRTGWINSIAARISYIKHPFE